jgi:2-polyprenyl-3-methyl-5-hydroxy-6-metoxy-1,4-benzoquinol methylase
MRLNGSPLIEKWRFSCDAPVISVAATPNCSVIAAATVGRSLYVLDSEGNDALKPTGFDGRGILDFEGWSTAIAADGSAVAVGTANKEPSNGSVYVFDLNGQNMLTECLRTPIWSLSFSSNGKVLAATGWDGNAYRFERKGSSYRYSATYRSKNSRGLYGIKLNAAGTNAYINSYDEGLIILDQDWKEISRLPFGGGGYNLAFAEPEGLVVAGKRGGQLSVIDISSASAEQLAVNGCDRAICGIAASANGDLLLAGGFDGWVRLLNRAGQTLGRFETHGEVWSLACSSDASRVCVGSGDHLVRVLENSCTSGVLKEVMDFESATVSEAQLGTHLSLLTDLYSRFGLYEYGYENIREQYTTDDTSEHNVIDVALTSLLERATSDPATRGWAHYQLGIMQQKRQLHDKAIQSFQHSADDTSYTVTAMHKCAESFRTLGLETAVAACHRRARHQQLTADHKKALYNLGRSYEDSGQVAGAIKNYQMLVSWDIAYRNTWERLDALIREADGNGAKRSDYTGLTTNLLGPNVPLNVDKKLAQVIIARTAELGLDNGDSEAISSIVKDLRSNARFSRGISRKGLKYDQELFVKYDFALPEDESKKFLETVNLFSLLRGLNLDGKYTLDIGAATGRYPMLLAGKGAKSHGIDISDDAIKYAQSQKDDGALFPKYVKADATRAFPTDLPLMSLVTCMMGTFAHFPRVDQPEAVNRMFDAVEDGGFVAISTWDRECTHLSYLSIYDEAQKELIVTNSPSQADMIEMFERAGFSDIETRPYCLLPEIILYDLGLEELGAVDIELAAQTDLAIRSLYPSKHGELFITFAQK